MTTLSLSDGSGTIIRYADMASQHIPARNVDVWLPPGYERNRAARYPVIYMHDGQNLFDPAQAYTGIDWGVDEAIMRLMGSSGWAGAIVVGVWNTQQRWREYMPARPLEGPTGRALLPEILERAGGPPVSNQYLRFLTDELKPLIDTAYRTQPEREHTFVMGSSMGGLISLYALAEYPAVFGGAGCLSTHWPAGGNLLVDYFGAAIPRAGQHRLYFDYGTATLDASYEPFQKRMDDLLRAAGYSEGRDWETRKFPGAEHTERAWRARVELPLAFLLGL
ncbi:MAG: alpha/beta hydrolase-fold protein [Roseiflexaceae bacterium]